MDDERREVAIALFKALKRSGPDALVQGEPDYAVYSDSDGSLLDGVMIDGHFDLMKAATILLEAGLTLETHHKSVE